MKCDRCGKEETWTETTGYCSFYVVTKRVRGACVDWVDGWRIKDDTTCSNCMEFIKSFLNANGFLLVEFEGTKI